MVNKIKGFGGIAKVITLLSFLLLAPVFSFADEAPSTETKGKEAFDPGKMIIEHVSDAHTWHVIGDVHVPLPVILYSKEHGLMVFSSSKIAEGAIYKAEANSPFGFKEEGVHVVVANADGTINKAETDKIWDFSITKNTATVFLIAILLLWVFISVAKAYTNRGQSAPKGLQSFMEPVILFIRDDIAVPSIGKHKADKYMPYLLTLFFFILFFNVFGLIPVFPGGANTMGNISITMTFAVMTFIITMASSNKAFWAHTLWMPNVPAVIKILILTPIEILGIFLKPFTLIVRIFANILAGHIIALSLIGLIFIIGNINKNKLAIIQYIYINKMFIAYLTYFQFPYNEIGVL